eukprot:m.339074 g.339074  ORF g.339074 m.339074 type:complete len:385 (+) comp18651_c0_seq1:251-1405(+)
MTNSTQREGETFLKAAIGCNGLSLVACLGVLFLIWLYKETAVPRQRFILLLFIVTLLFNGFSMIWHAINLVEGDEYRVPEIVVFGDFAFWWALLTVETYMLGFLLHVLRVVNQTSKTGSQRMTIAPRIEVLAWFTAIAIGAVAGTIALVTVGENCSHYRSIQVDDETKKEHTKACYADYKGFVLAYIASLVVPVGLQIALIVHYLRAKRRIRPDGQQYTTTQVLARQRVLVYTVRPLIWYPILFLVSAACYVLWAIGLFSNSKKSKFPEDAAIASALTFSLKGFLNAVIYLCSRDAPAKGFMDQLKTKFLVEEQAVNPEDQVEFSTDTPFEEDEQGLYGDPGRSHGKSSETGYSYYYSSGASSSYYLLDEDSTRPDVSQASGLS